MRRTARKLDYNLAPIEALTDPDMHIEQVSVGEGLVVVKNSAGLKPIELDVMTLGAIGKSVPATGKFIYYSADHTKDIRQSAFRALKVDRMEQAVTRLFELGSFVVDHYMSLPALSPSQQTLLGRMQEDLTEENIADELHISVHTVHQHAGIIYDKWAVHNRPEAVFIGHVTGALPPAALTDTSAA